jgi:alpha-tubulin suppressor-like RCC1 family protein
MSPSKMKAGVSNSSLWLWLTLAAFFAVPLKAVAQTTTAWDWGFNAYGQLGNGTSTDSNVPVQTLPELTSLTKVAGGAWHGLALGPPAGTSTVVYAWGNNDFGQLGNGSTVSSNVPVSVSSTWPDYGTPTEIAAGGEHSLAITLNGTSSIVWAWGNNDYGQLGLPADNPIPANLYSPLPIIGGSGFFPASSTAIAVAAGAWHSLALTTDGAATSVWAWGNNDYWQLANNGSSTSTPTLVSGLSGLNVTAIAAGDSHNLALVSSNGTSTVFAWGNNDFGQLGYSGSSTSTPLQVDIPGVVIAIAAGAFHSLALTSGGEVYAWGDNSYGQLGDNSTAFISYTPVNSTSTGFVNVKRIAAGALHSLALTYDGTSTTLWAWGENEFGELGNSANANSPFPVEVSVPGGYQVNNSTSTIAGGWLHSLAVLEALPEYCTTVTTTLLSQTPVTLGETITDTATVDSTGTCTTLSTGQVKFYYQANGTSTAGWTLLSTNDVTTSSTSTATGVSDGFTASTAGTYYFKAVFVSNNSDRGGSESTNEEQLVVNKAPTSVTTKLSRSVILSTESCTDTLTISASLTSPPITGSWELQASKNSSFPVGETVTLGSGSAPPSTHTVTINGSALGSGLWYIRAVYAGDDNYLGSQSGNWDEILIVL